MTWASEDKYIEERDKSLIRLKDYWNKKDIRAFIMEGRKLEGLFLEFTQAMINEKIVKHDITYDVKPDYMDKLDLLNEKLQLANDLQKELVDGNISGKE